jgi:ACS family glucarate transporter-like MFS transporter
VRFRQRHILIGLLFFHSVNTIMDRVAISSAKSSIIRDLGLTDQMMGWVFGIFALGYALFQVPAGWFADRYGARKALTWVVTAWSAFTMLTGAAVGAVSMLVVRFLFGVGEAGAYPGATRAYYSWLPVKERGIGQGIMFSGARLGAAVSLFTMPLLIGLVGWRWTFVLNGLVGVIWAAVWRGWFRDDPKDNPRVTPAELAEIEADRGQEFVASTRASFSQIFTSLNMALAMFQYFAHNVTFFICYTWLLPYLESQWGYRAIFYAPLPLLAGALANWVSGGLVTRLYRDGHHVGSRRVPAIIGYALAAVGLLLATQTGNVVWFIVFFSVAIFGIDMILSPSWAFCMDIGGDKSGAVSASMNMVGNIGAALSAILFPFFAAHITLPYFAEATGTGNSFFVFAAALNVGAVGCWLVMDPNREANPNLSPLAVKVRMVLMLAALVALAGGSLVYKTMFLD